MPAGRPLKHQDPDQLLVIGNKWIDDRLAAGEPLTINGLALALDIAGRRCLLDYELRPEYTHAIKSLKARVENWLENRLHTAASPVGPIFALKNFGWSDRQEVTHQGPNGSAIEVNGKFTIELVSPSKTAAD